MISVPGRVGISHDDLVAHHVLLIESVNPDSDAAKFIAETSRR
jgi:hypothetical protein